MFRTRIQSSQRFTADTKTLTESYGRFYAEPFERGFATILGNALRRAILSSLEGAAITAVQIEGAPHEFAQLTGVVEDATDVLLNLKALRFKLLGDGPKTLRLSKQGPGEVTAADIETDVDTEVLDPSAHIASLSEQGSLHIQMRLQRARGYVTAENNADDNLPVGYIPIDSLHSPVKRVTYGVEPARVVNNIDFEKLMIEVWTDGSIRPEQAITIAAQYLMNQFTVFASFDPLADIVPVTKVSASSQPYLPVEELDLSVRSHNLLMRAGIRTIGDLATSTEESLWREPNFGKKSLDEIRKVLNSLGLDLGMRLDTQGNLVPKSREENFMNWGALHEAAADPDVPEADETIASSEGISDEATVAFPYITKRADKTEFSVDLSSQISIESLTGVRELLQEESVARNYVTTRYKALIDEKYLHGLSSAQQIELDQLIATLDQMDKVYYESIIHRLRTLVDNQANKASASTDQLTDGSLL